MMFLSPDRPTSGDLVDFMEELGMDQDVPDAGRLRWDSTAGSEE